MVLLASPSHTFLEDRAGPLWAFCLLFRLGFAFLLSKVKKVKS